MQFLSNSSNFDYCQSVRHGPEKYGKNKIRTQIVAYVGKQITPQLIAVVLTCFNRIITYFSPNLLNSRNFGMYGPSGPLRLNEIAAHKISLRIINDLILEPVQRFMELGNLQFKSLFVLSAIEGASYHQILQISVQRRWLGVDAKLRYHRTQFQVFQTSLHSLC